jgi:Protein of unknown function (DUF2637)
MWGVLTLQRAVSGSFAQIRGTAAEHGQGGPMAWVVAVCIDLTCVIAARERQRDNRSSPRRPLDRFRVLMVLVPVLANAGSPTRRAPLGGFWPTCQLMWWASGEHRQRDACDGSSISAMRTERTAHPGPLGRVSARQGDLEPVSGFEPLTVRLQGQSR